MRPETRTPKQGVIYDKEQAYIDSGVRNIVESKFGIGKVRYRLSRVMTKLKETSESYINMAFLAMNLVKVLAAFVRALLLRLLHQLKIVPC